VRRGYLLSAKILRYADCLAIRSLALGSAIRYVNHLVCHPLYLKLFCDRVLFPEVRALS
jgi:hypothetical protein